MQRTWVRISIVAAFLVVAIALGGSPAAYASELPAVAADFPTALVPGGAQLLTLAEMDAVSGEGIGGLLISAVVHCAMNETCRNVVVKGLKIGYQVAATASLVDWLCDGCVMRR